MARNNSIISSQESSFYVGAFVAYYALVGIVLGQCESKDCKMTDVLTMAGYIDGFLLLTGIINGLIVKRVSRNQDETATCLNLPAAAGFLAMNALLAIGATLAYLRDGDSYTVRRLNIGAAIVGGLFFILPISRLLNYYCDSRNEEREERRPLYP